VDSPKFGPWWVLWVRVCLWLIRAPKCSNYALTNLLFGLCKFMWVSELLVNLPSPISELQHTPTPPSVVFTFRLVVESIKELGGVCQIVLHHQYVLYFILHLKFLVLELRLKVQIGMMVWFFPFKISYACRTSHFSHTFERLFL
jgi:hypothetical protein